MFGFEDISLKLAYPVIYFLIALLLIGGYAYFIYRITIPPSGKYLKIILVTTRTFALLLILFIFFEPIISFSKKIILEPVNLFFIDNSRSITIEDGTKRTESVKKIINDLKSRTFSESDEYYLFGESVKEIPKDSLLNYNFADAVTNFSSLFSSIKREKKNYASITVISDGVINSGSNSLLPAKTLGLPVFTIGLGDTSQVRDASIKRVLSNNLLYVESPTTIEATIKQSGMNNKEGLLSLFENSILLEQKNITLNNSGIQTESFTYTPQTPGEKKLTVALSNTNDELSYANNKNVFYVNVLTNKVKILLLSSTPSSDLAFVKSTLKEDDNFNVKSITELSGGRYFESGSQNFIDSADIFFLIGFPSASTNDDLLNRVTTRILNDNIPFFISLSDYTEIDRLRPIQQQLPFTARKSFGREKELQPLIFENQQSNSIIQNNASNIISAWNDLPPVNQNEMDFYVKPGSVLISGSKMNNNVRNSPLLISRSFGGSRSIALIASNYWRWKLQTVRDNNHLFDSFIINSVKWLNASDEHKRVNIRSLKQNYSPGEMVEFVAQVYDESLNPVSNADVRLNITSDKEKYELTLQNAGKGIYEGKLRINGKGDFKYNASAVLNGRNLGNDNGIFNIGDMDIEMMNPRMDFNFLNLLSMETKGKFAFANSYTGLFDEIRLLNEKGVKEKIVISDLSLWSDEWLMVIVIFLFSLEWFLRKRAGML